jgi:hypothetical protein
MNAPVMRTAEANAASVVEPATGHSVLSNLPMFVVGLSGLAWARCQSECSPAVAKRNGVRRWPDAEAVCSARCPVHPTSATLISDRRPLAVAMGGALLVNGVSATLRRPTWTRCFREGIHCD